VRATNSAGASDYSNVATTPGPPVIVQGPVGTNVFLGGQAVFSVTASGTAPLAYQWRFNAAALLNQTNSTLILSNVQPSDGGVYAVRVTNLFGNVISSGALLNVSNRPPVASGYATARFPSQGVKFRASLLGGVDPDGDTLVLTAITPNSPNGGSISRVGDWVIYSPPDGFTNADSFLYLLRDGRGGSATGAVAVAVMNDLQTAENVVTENVGGDSIRLRFSGVPGRAYTIQFCDDADHLNWQPLATRTAETDGHFEYTDTPPAASPARLYRSSYP